LYTLEIFQGKFNLTYFGDLIANFKIQLSGWWQPLNEIMESLKRFDGNFQGSTIVAYE
jgi:hypothetical protein